MKMISSNQEKEDETKMMMIPVFTVIKNGVILKNIFVINNNINSSSSSSELNSVTDQETEEEILIVGRHPDCNIVLLHPSVSRFHLQINSIPSLQKLFVTDLSSVHGTWVSEKKIDPGLSVELKEDDTIRVGSSTRVYRLHWVPLSRAYDIENPFVSPSDLAMIEENEKENAMLEEKNVDKISQDEFLLATENKHDEGKDTVTVLGNAEEIYQDMNSMSTETGEIQSVDSVHDGIVSLFPDENSGFIKEIPSAPLMPENMDPSFHVEKEEIICLSRNGHELSFKTVGETILQTLSQLFCECKQSSDYHSSIEAVLEEGKRDISTARIGIESNVEVSNQSSDYHSAIEAVLEEKKAGISLEGIEIESNSELTSSSVPESDANSACETLEEAENQSMLRRDHKQMDTIECVNCCLPEDLPEISNEQQISKRTQILEPLASLYPSLEEGNQENSMENQSSDYHSAIEAGLEENKTRIPMDGIELESNAEVTSSSAPELDANSACEILEEAENQGMLRKDHKHTDTLGRVNCSLSEEDLSEISNEQTSKRTQILEPLAALRPSFEEGNQENSMENRKLNTMASLQTGYADNTAATEILEDKENQNSSVKDYRQIEFKGVFSLAIDSVNSSLSLGDVLSEIVYNKESQTPQSNFPAIVNLENVRSPPIGSEKKPTSGNIWSRRGKPATPLQLQTSKPATPLQLQTSRSLKKNRSIDDDVEWENQDDESKSIKRVLFSSLEPMDEEEIFTSDKENRTPNSFLRKSFKKKCQLKDIQSPKFCSSSSKIIFSPSIEPDEDMTASSYKENQTRKVFQLRKSARPSRHQMKLEEDIVLKERRSERVPLLSLFTNSPGKSLSDDPIPDAAASSSNSINCTQKVTNSTSINSVGDGRRRWTMIADTTSLLDKVSRKSLELLEGLKGTNLVIPRLVIRELDSLKRRGSLFRRTTEADLALQWIEECMVKTKWWIRVQSTVEDRSSIAPTPPASPVPQFSEGSRRFPYGTTSSASFSAYGSLLEIVSPTAEDHILDYALSCRKMNNEEQLVLLSNDVTLKIKAMAEGLICETPQEFRESLVNPFSERFLWADSSPRGQTWSVLDDIVLKEKYYRSPSKKLSKGEGAKGLKLILLHNSHYGQFVKTM